jgi:hypothetical protein
MGGREESEPHTDIVFISFLKLNGDIGDNYGYRNPHKGRQHMSEFTS